MNQYLYLKNEKTRRNKKPTMIKETEIREKLAEELTKQTEIIGQLNDMTQIEFAEFGNATRLNRDVTKGKIEAMKWILEIVD